MVELLHQYEVKISFGEAGAMKSKSLKRASEESVGTVLGQLEDIIASRKTADTDRSYTSKLFAGGVAKIGLKITEEAGELVEAAANESDERVVSEAADLFYHAIVLLAHRDLTLSQVETTLAGRFGVSGLEEKASRKQSL